MVTSPLLAGGRRAAGWRPDGRPYWLLATGYWLLFCHVHACYNGTVTVAVLFALSGLMMLGGGMYRGNPVAVLIGAFLLADSIVMYVIFGPGEQFIRTLLFRG